MAKPTKAQLRLMRSLAHYSKGNTLFRREWRTFKACERRGWVEWSALTASGRDVVIITSAGRAALEEATK